MKSRISGKEIRSEYKTYKCGGKDCIDFEDMFHLDMINKLRITDDEYDMLLLKSTDEELGLLINGNPTYAGKRRIIEMMNNIKNLNNENK